MISMKRWNLFLPSGDRDNFMELDTQVLATACVGQADPRTERDIRYLPYTALRRAR